MEMQCEGIARTNDHEKENKLNPSIKQTVAEIAKVANKGHCY